MPSGVNGRRRSSGNFGPRSAAIACRTSTTSMMAAMSSGGRRGPALGRRFGDELAEFQQGRTRADVRRVALATFVFQHADEGIEFCHAMTVRSSQPFLHAARAVDQDFEVV